MKKNVGEEVTEAPIFSTRVVPLVGPTSLTEAA
jgi:hypothetical protein